MPIYFIEGNIGTGKSTFLSMIETLFPENQVIYEPIDIWSSFTDEYGNSILDYFYKDQKRYAYTFQSLAFISRIEKKNIELLLRLIQHQRPKKICDFRW